MFSKLISPNIPHGNNKENLLENQELFTLEIISFILMTFTFDLTLKLLLVTKTEFLLTISIQYHVDK